MLCFLLCRDQYQKDVGYENECSNHSLLSCVVVCSEKKKGKFSQKC